MNLAIIREWYILIPMIVITIFTIGVGIWASKQNKKREDLMSKKDEEKAMKEALELFEQENKNHPYQQTPDSFQAHPINQVAPLRCKAHLKIGLCEKD